MASHLLSPDIVQLALEVGDPGGATSLEAALAARLTLTCLADIKCTVVLADPMIYDCPLIGCSDGFETLTGYSKSEIRGRNCRFLNETLPMKPQMRKALRSATATGTEFMGIVSNVRKNGETFRNFLHMTSVSVGGHRYIIGIQSDVTDIELDLTDASHLDDLRAIAEHIFAANVDAWVHLQVYKFQIWLPIPYAEVIKRGAIERYKEAQRKNVKIAGLMVHSKNSFLHVKDSMFTKHASYGLQKTASDPLLFDCSVEVVPSTDFSESSTSGACASASHSNSYQADVSADSSEGSHSHVRSSEEGENPKERPKEPPSSIGSMLHPDRCKECTFFFFGTQGCTKGSNCRYCHEFHPRKNLRKNRRLLKLLHVDGCAITSEDSPPFEDFGATLGSASVQAFTSGNNSKDLGLPLWSVPRPSEHGLVSMPAESSAGKTAARTSQHAFGTSAMTSIRYLRHGHELRRSKLTLVVGEVAHVPARVESRMESSARKALEDAMSFSVEPPLQQGLELDPHTGLISGVPMDCQARKRHVVTASIAATGPGGINLGLVPLASTSLLIRITDPEAARSLNLAG
mmetsp:Transcript_136817/g.249409  ORF Transcript_136817/g.249409 Transcript_136817/m.249409 type:complete len:573 (+) Transcript_136817:113-1831(+)